MKKQVLKIGTKWITQPNYLGEIISETPCTVTLKISRVVFTPKSSKTFTHKFSKAEREHFSSIKGQIRKFWKKSGFQIGSQKTFLMQKLLTN